MNDFNNKNTQHKSEPDLMQTTCTECGSVFQLNLPQLLAADGQVRCSQCNEVFDAHINLVKNTPAQPEINIDDDQVSNLIEEITDQAEETTVSLADAMNDGKHLDDGSTSFSKLLFPIGILILIFIGLIQWIYYDRLNLIKNPEKQNLILSLCQYIPCDETQFSNLQQFKLIERNIFTHPTRPSALLISGSFVNEAPFSQKTPSLKVSLFNLSGEITSQRLFKPIEYSINLSSDNTVAPGERISFQIEVVDPDTVTITYEFEFI